MFIFYSEKMITKIITKKIKGNLKFAKISNVTVAAVMQLSRDCVEVSGFRFQDLRLTKRRPCCHSIYLFISLFHV